MSRWKRVIGDGLRSQTDGRQGTEVAIAAEVLNRMLDLVARSTCAPADRQGYRERCVERSDRCNKVAARRFSQT